MLATRHQAAVTDSRIPGGFGGLFYGVYPALVTDIVDPDGQGRAVDRAARLIQELAGD